MPVAAGKLRHRIALTALQTTTSPYGETVTEYVPAGEVWADVAPLSMKEHIASQALQAPITHRITIRFRSDITAEWRIQFRGKTYGIHSILPDAESGLGHLTIEASEVAP